MQHCTEMNTTAVDGGAVSTGVTEKYESELLEKSTNCEDSVSEVHNTDATELSVKDEVSELERTDSAQLLVVSTKEEGELSSERCILVTCFVFLLTYCWCLIIRCKSIFIYLLFNASHHIE